MPPTHPRGYSHDLRALTAADAPDPRAAASDPGLPGGPTIEEWIRAGSAAADYPPMGYQAVNSVGWQHEQARRLAEVAPVSVPDPPMVVGTLIADDEAREIDWQFGVDLPLVADPTAITGDFPPLGAPDLPVIDPLPADDGGTLDSNLI